MPMNSSVAIRVALRSQIDNLYTINSALEVDLFGQAFSELRPSGFVSGPGGGSDFAAGARGGGGLRIVALPATIGSGGATRIVAPEKSSGPISLGRFDIDVVVTEFGVAHLRGKGYDERAEALIAVAAFCRVACVAARGRCPTISLRTIFVSDISTLANCCRA